MEEYIQRRQTPEIILDSEISLITFICVEIMTLNVSHMDISLFFLCRMQVCSILIPEHGKEKLWAQEGD